MAECTYYFVRDVMAIMEIKERKAYDIIRQFNKELEAEGVYTVPGRIKKSYFHYRTDIQIPEACKKRKPARVAV
ncbi:MAG: hypothetical protein FWE19_00360 [Oscillospiraceae bacterium]|nr:hypothetical protein [Oscillospiraceae bacterium]